MIARCARNNPPSFLHATVTQKILQRDLTIPLQSTTRVDLANIALTMAELSIFEPQQLTIIPSSPSKEEDIAGETDSITFNCPSVPGDPSQNIMAMITQLSARIDELQGKLESERQDRVSEQRDLKAQLTTLQPIARRILMDAYISVKGYRPSSSGARGAWISSNIVTLLPPTGTTAAAFEQKLASYRKSGSCAHTTETLAIALAVDALGPDEDLEYMFHYCFGHRVEEALNRKVSSTPVDVGKDGVAHFQKTLAPIS